MNKKEIFFKIGVIPTIFLVICLSIFLMPFFYSWEIGETISSFDVLFRFVSVSSDAQIFSWAIFIFFLTSISFFVRFLFLLNYFNGYPSLGEAKKYYREKKLLEQKKRLHSAKLLHEDRLQKLEEEKKKFL